MKNKVLTRELEPTLVSVSIAFIYYIKYVRIWIYNFEISRHVIHYQVCLYIDI